MKTSVKEQIKKIDEQIQNLYIKKNELISLDKKNNKIDIKYDKSLKYSDYLLSYII